MLCFYQYQNQLFQQTDEADGKTEIIIKVSTTINKFCLYFRPLYF